MRIELLSENYDLDSCEGIKAISWEINSVKYGKKAFTCSSSLILFGFPIPLLTNRAFRSVRSIYFIPSLYAGECFLSRGEFDAPQ